MNMNRRLLNRFEELVIDYTTKEVIPPTVINWKYFLMEKWMLMDLSLFYDEMLMDTLSCR